MKLLWDIVEHQQKFWQPNGTTFAVSMTCLSNLGKNSQIQIVSSSKSLALDLAKKFCRLCLALWQGNMDMWVSWTMWLDWKHCLVARKGYWLGQRLWWSRTQDSHYQLMASIWWHGKETCVPVKGSSILQPQIEWCAYQYMMAVSVYQSNEWCAYQYMIAVSVYQSKIVVIYSPYPGGYWEIEIFQDHIKTKSSKENMLWLTNPVDSWDNKEFKACVVTRHEMVNRQIKPYNSMADTQKHGMDKHGNAIRAVAATVQYKMDNGSELFPVFVNGLMQQASAANNITSEQLLSFVSSFTFLFSSLFCGRLLFTRGKNPCVHRQ
jgi:hypothetical protein